MRSDPPPIFVSRSIFGTLLHLVSVLIRCQKWPVHQHSKRIPSVHSQCCDSHHKVQGSFKNRTREGRWCRHACCSEVRDFPYLWDLENGTWSTRTAATLTSYVLRLVTPLISLIILFKPAPRIRPFASAGNRSFCWLRSWYLKGVLL